MEKNVKSMNEMETKMNEQTKKIEEQCEEKQKLAN